MTNYANKNIRKIKPYSPPLEGRRNFEGKLLDFNEKTIPTSKKVIKALKNLISDNQIQLYPEYNSLCGKIAAYSGVRKDQVMITNGSDQGIDLVFRIFTEKGDKVVIPSPSFAMFYQCAQIVGNKVFAPLYNKNGSFPTQKVLQSIKKGVKLVVICNPNNPTGTTVELKNIEKIIRKALKFNTVVYIDEAYFEFCKITAVKLINRYPNLIITRTFSKAFGLASLRIGYVISSQQNISEMLKVRGPYDINMPAVMAAKAALNDLKSLNKYVDEVMNKAKPMVEDFFKKNDIGFYKSRANFLLFKTENPSILAEKLKNSRFLTRPHSGKRIEDTIRVTIGTVSQMKEFINQFKNA